jgi:hypothetical protein
MSRAGRDAGLANIGTHRLRKTFWNHVFRRSGDSLATVQKFPNHSSSGDTLRYIGIDRKADGRRILRAEPWVDFFPRRLSRSQPLTKNSAKHKLKRPREARSNPRPGAALRFFTTEEFAPKERPSSLGAFFNVS